MPEFSIIIPVYNRASIIQRTLDCFLRQGISEDRYEVILIDDGSTDNSFEMVSPWLKKHSNTQWYSFANGGVSKARNRGIERAKGDYLIFLDSDDLLYDGYLSKLSELLEKKQYDMIVSDFIYRNGTKEIISSAGFESGEYRMSEHPDLFRAFFMNLQTHALASKAVNRAFLNSFCIRFDESISIYEDAKFGFELFKYAEEIYYRREPSYYYYLDTANSLMHKPKKDYVKAMNNAFSLLFSLIDYKKWPLAERQYFELKYVHSTVDLLADELSHGGDFYTSLIYLEDHNLFNLSAPNPCIDVKFRIYRYCVVHRLNMLVKTMIRLFLKQKERRK